METSPIPRTTSVAPLMSPTVVAIFFSSVTITVTIALLIHENPKNSIFIKSDLHFPNFTSNIISNKLLKAD